MSTSDLRCDRCSSAIEADDLRCPVCNLKGPARTGEDRPGIAVDILRCSGCGAAMTYEVSKRAAACAFCGSVLEIEHPADPMEEARFLLPFTVDRTQAEAAFRAWLQSLGWFRPGDLRTEASVETIQPLRWVGWVFDARAEVSWAADTDHDTRRSNWAPHAGHAEITYDNVVVPASRGLTRDEVGLLLSSYDLGTATSGVDLVDDATLERFDVPRSTARTRLIEAVEKVARRRLQERHLPGRRSRKLSVATVLRSLAARRFAFPAWVLAYRYKNRLFRTVLSGQDATCLKGEAPYSVFRIAAAVTAAAAAGALLILLGLFL